MKTFIILLSFLAILTVSSLSSCGKDDGAVACGATWGTDLQKEVNAISTALTNYINDQSTANCTALKSAYQAYINELEPYGKCATLTSSEKSQFNAALAEAEDDLETLCD